MVESQIVILVVAGSNPVGHPIFHKKTRPARERTERVLLIFANDYSVVVVVVVFSSTITLSATMWPPSSM